MDEIPIVGPKGSAGNSGVSQEYAAYLAERRKTTNSIIGLVAVFGILAIVGATIVISVMAANGVFGG